MKKIDKISVKRFYSMLLLLLGMCSLTACAQQPVIPGGSSGGVPSTVPTTVPSVSLPTVPSEPLRQIRFVDQKSGWALTKDRVLHTLDGGKTWVDVTRRGNGGSMMDGGAQAMAVFQTANRAWVFVPVAKNSSGGAGVTVNVWRTENGGITWASSSFEDDESLWFADRPHFAGAQYGWIMLSTGAGAGSFGVHLYQTKNGGVAWTQIAAAPGKIPLSGEKAGPSFLDEKNGWLAVHVGALTDSPLLYNSIDGGVNWSKHTLPTLSGISNADYRTTPPVIFGQVLLVPVHVSSEAGKHLVMYTSDNGGGKWYAGPPADFDTDNVYIVDQNHALALDKGNVYATKDGITHWSKVGSLPDTADAMSFINAQEGWSLDKNTATLYHTTDGGTSWEKINYNFVSAS